MLKVSGANEVTPCGSEVRRFVMVYGVDEIEAMFPVVVSVGR
jgi:hypothetical protein